MSETKEFIKELYKKYPLAEVQDVYKALFQSTFGCEHLVHDEEAAADYIKREANECLLHRCGTEPLMGEYCRVYLDVIKNGLSAETFARLFVMSAEAVHDNDFEEKLAVFADMAKNGDIPAEYEAVDDFIEKMREQNYPPCHHSETYRREYHPAYRLMKKKYARYIPLFTAIDRLMREKERVVAAIDGGAASGKTTLAKLLDSVYDANIFHMDDFFLREEQRTPERFAEIGGNVDRERFLDEVLTPLCSGELVNYRRFDCSTFTVKDGIEIAPKKLNIVEGSYSMHPELSGYYDYSVFLEVSDEVQRERIITRNARMADRFFNEWIPLEMKYFNGFAIRKKCDLVVENV